MQKKRKICIIVPAHWEALMGGSQYQAKILIEQMVPLEKYEIYYLARRVKQGFTPAGYSIVKIAEPCWYHRYGYFPDSLRLLRILSRIKPDVIYQQVGCAYTGVAAYYAKRSGCKMVWRVTSDKSLQQGDGAGFRELLPDRFIERKMLEYGIRNAGAIVVQTESQASLLKSNFQLEPSAVIRNFHPMPAESIDKGGVQTVLWVANFKKLKQPEVFIKLASDLSGTGARFIMIGAPATGVWQQDLEGCIAGIQGLTYLGIKTQEEVNGLLARSHILVNTSQYEGFSNTFIQAWMRKVPVVSLSVNPDHLLDDGRLGYCADGSYEMLKQHVAFLLSDPAVAGEIGLKAQSYAVENYSENNVGQLIEILDSP